ncbi:MAG TPA: YhjD/YihY/BrkB family envelope integrity protein [Miltoncostaeaceae bacterium]|nr:YhjD/YihY/BrkB family envelope integrity protein [Miltoncostaeaceae bacterium]
MKPERKGRLTDAVERARLESERAREYAEDARQRSPAVALAFDVYERDRRHLGGLLSGALAYRFFLWLLPFTLLLVGLLGAFTAADDGTPAELSDDLGLQGTLTDLVRDAAQQKGWWIALLLGLFGTAYAGIGAVRALRIAHSAAWAIPPTRMANPAMASLWLFLVVVAALAASGLATFLRERSGVVGSLATILGMAVLYFLIWLRISEVLPHRDVGRRGLVPGAVLVALGLQGLHLFTAYYLAGSAERATSVYGAIGAALAILLWLFIIARLIVGGAVLNAELAARRARSRPAPPPSS